MQAGGRRFDPVILHQCLGSGVVRQGVVWCWRLGCVVIIRVDYQGLMSSGFGVFGTLRRFHIKSTDLMKQYEGVPRSLTIGKKHNEVIVGLTYGQFVIRTSDKYGL